MSVKDTMSVIRSVSILMVLMAVTVIWGLHWYQITKHVKVSIHMYNLHTVYS